MDIALLSDHSLKLKIKKTNLIINPDPKTPKTEADVVIVTAENSDPARVKDYRVVISAPGEYEVGGLKISAARQEDGLVLIFNSDGKEIVWSTSSVLSKTPADKTRESSIAIIDADSELPQNVLTAMGPRAVVLYGEMAKQGAEALGKESISSGKTSIAEDKLPEETVVYILR
jgi:hypothetical protein